MLVVVVVVVVEEEVRKPHSFIERLINDFVQATAVEVEDIAVRLQGAKLFFFRTPSDSHPFKAEEEDIKVGEDTKVVVAATEAVEEGAAMVQEATVVAAKEDTRVVVVIAVAIKQCLAGTLHPMPFILRTFAFTF